MPLARKTVSHSGPPMFVRSSGEPVDHHAADQNVEEVNERAAQVLREQEHHVHDEKEDRQAEPAVKDNAVDLVGERRGSFADADNRLLGDVGHEVVASVGDGDIEVAVVFLVEVGNDLFDVGGIDVRKLSSRPGARSMNWLANQGHVQRPAS